MFSEISTTCWHGTITVNNYISLVEMQSSSTKNSTTSIKTLRKKISTNIAIPSPTEKSFSKDYSVWQNEWHSRLNNLENLIQQLPQLSKGDKKLLDTTVINIDLLENYNINENIETINTLFFRLSPYSNLPPNCKFSQILEFSLVVPIISHSPTKDISPPYVNSGTTFFQKYLIKHSIINLPSK